MHSDNYTQLSYDDPKCQRIVKSFNTFFKSFTIASPLRIFPWLKYIFPDQLGYTNIKEGFGSVYALAEETYQNHLESFDAENLRDFTDAYIKQQLGTLTVTIEQA